MLQHKWLSNLLRKCIFAMVVSYILVQAEGNSLYGHHESIYDIGQLLRCLKF